MKIWMGFLVLSFLLGGHEVRKQRPARTVVIFALAVAVTVALRSYSLV